jgi:hypothetical protein
MIYFNNRLYCKFENINDRIIKINNEFPDLDNPYFVLGSFNSTREAREYVKNSDELYTCIVSEFQFYEKDDFIFSDNILDVYKHLYKRIISKLIITKYLSTESLITSLIYFYCIYLFNKDNYFTNHDTFENDYHTIISSNDSTKIKHLNIFLKVRKREEIFIFFTNLNKMIKEMENAQSIDEVDSLFQKQLKEIRNHVQF